MRRSLNPEGRSQAWAGLLLMFLLVIPVRASSPNPLLAGVVAVLPDVPLVVGGDLVTRDAEGEPSGTFRVEMVLDWKANVPTARYTVRDAFGEPLQHLAITWLETGLPEYQYFEGSPLAAAPLPPLNQPILNTDLTWLDLSLSFLWWPGGEARGEGTVRGRDCDIIDVAAPDHVVSDFDGVRLWVDRKIGIVLRAEGYSGQAELRRRMEVRSFKKINSRWVIKDLEFESFPDKTRTSLIVRKVEERERFNLPDRDTRAWEPDEGVAGETIDTLPDLETDSP